MAPYSPKMDLISTKEASEISGYTSDYLGRLVRSGKISGERIGRAWLIHHESLTAFMVEQGSRKAEQAQELARVRASEYREANAPIRRITKTLSAPLALPKIPLPTSLVRREAFALATALLIMSSGAYMAHAAPFARIATDAMRTMENVAIGFADIAAPIPAHVVRQIDDAQIAVRDARSAASAYLAHFSAEVPPPFLSRPDIARVQMDIPSAAVEPRLARVENSATPIRETESVSLSDARSTLVAAKVLAGNPQIFAEVLARGYEDTGSAGLRAISSVQHGYLSLIAASGEAALAIALPARDGLAASPELIARMNMGIGEGVVALAHLGLDAELAAVHGLVALGPAVGEAVTIAIGGVGSAAVDGVATVAPAGLALALEAAEVPARTAPQLAALVWRAEWATAEIFLAAVDTLTGEYLALVNTSGAATHAGASVALEGVDGGLAVLQSAEPVLANAYLGILGKSALFMETMPERIAALPYGEAVLSAAAAAGPALSAGERIALSTYRGFRSVFDSANRTLATILAPAPVIVLPNPAAAEPAVATTPSGPSSVTTNTYPTYTTVVRGASEEYVSQGLSALRADILATVGTVIAPVARQAATNITTIQQVNMIQDLSNLIVRNGDFRGGIFEGGRVNSATYLSATEGSITTFTAGATTLATTTVTGNLSVSGTLSPDTIEASTRISAPYFTATSTTATSTFAGGLAIETSGFVYDYQTNSVGIGTASPAYTLDVSGTSRITATSTAAYFAASALGAAGAPAFTFSNDLNTGFWSSGADTLNFSTGGSERLRVTSGGFVGIGTTSPTGLLAIQGSGDGSNLLYIAGYGGAARPLVVATSSSPNGFVSLGIGSTSPYAQLSILGGDNADNFVIDSSSTGGQFTFNSTVGDGILRIRSFPGSVEAVRIHSGGSSFFDGGNVGIGNTSPTFKFDVTGDTRVTGLVDAARLVATSTTATSTFAGGLAIETSGFVYDYQTNSVGIGTASPVSSLHIEKSGSGVTGPAIFLRNSATSAVNNATEIAFANDPGGSYTGVSGSRIKSITQNASNGASDLTFTTWNGSVEAEKLRITNTGNVGIGTTTPSYPLDVNGDFRVGEAGSSNAFFVDATNGKVGIRTAGPGFNLTVAGDVDLTDDIGSGAAQFAVTGATNSANRTVIGYDTTDNFGYIAASTYLSAWRNLVLNPIGTGNVGIGNTSPTFKLDVSGDTRVTGLVDAARFVATSTTATSTFAGGLRVSGSTEFSDGTASAPSLTFANDLDTGFYRVGANNPALSVGGAKLLEFNVTGSPPDTFLKITNQGNGNASYYLDFRSAGAAPNLSAHYNVAGAGTHVFSTGGDSRYTSFVVNNANNAVDYWTVYGASTGNPVYFLPEGSSTNIPGRFYSKGTGSLSFYTNSLERLFIDGSTGNIGIGTTSPGQKLSVAGDILGNNFIGSYFTATSSTATSTLAGGFAIETSGFVYDYSTNKVGIGTAAPSHTLTVLGSTGDIARIHDGSQGAYLNTSSGLAEWVGYTGSGYNNIGLRTGSAGTGLTLDTSSNLGLNGASRSFPNGGGLDIYRADYPRIRLSNSTTGTASTDGYGLTGNGLDLNIENVEAGNVTIYTNGSERLRVTSTGNVGIGTTSPGQKLSVHGNALFSGNITSVSSITATSTITGANLVASSATATSTLAGGLAIETSGFVYDFSSNNVGIGTASPWGKLHIVSGSSGASRNSTINDSDDLIVENNTHGGINILTPNSVEGSINFGDPQDFDMGRIVYSHSIDALGFYANNSERLRINSSGRVGIGTSTPGSQLEVFDGSNGSGKVDILSLRHAQPGTSGDGVALAFNGYYNNTDWKMGRISAINAGDGSYGANLIFEGKSGNGQSGALTEYARITYQGNLGIGTSTPGYPLDVNGDFRVGEAGSSNALFVDATNGKVGIGTNSPNSYAPFGGITPDVVINTSKSYGGILINASAGTSPSLSFTSAGSELWSISSRAESPVGRLAFYGSGITELFTLAQSGNVGIGETAPGSKLSVSGSGSFGASYDTTAAPANGLIIEGNVGIGTTSPGQKLSVAGDILGNNFIGSYFTGTSTTASTLAGALTSSGIVTGSALVASSATATSTLAGGLAIETNGFVYDYSSNNVGIGDATPQFKLEVNGEVGGVVLTSQESVDANSTELSLVAAGSLTTIRSTFRGSSAYVPLAFEVGGSERARLTTGGFLGIGTSTPGYPLDVNGDFRVGEAGSSNALFVDATNARVGIGKSSPSVALDVQGTASSTGMVVNGTASITQSANFVNTQLTITNSDGGASAAAGLALSNGTSALSIFQWSTGVGFQNNRANGSMLSASGVGGITLFADNASGEIHFAAGGSTSNQARISTGGHYLSADGAAATPGLSFLNDTNTGLFRSGADALGLATGGAERVSVTSAGLVGIGSTTPQTTLSVVGSAYITAGLGVGVLNTTSGTAKIGTVSSGTNALLTVGNGSGLSTLQIRSQGGDGAAVLSFANVANRGFEIAQTTANTYFTNNGGLANYSDATLASEAALTIGTSYNITVGNSGQTSNFRVESSNTDSTSATPAFQYRGAVLRIGDATTDTRTYASGLGIQFFDSGVAAALIKFDNANNQIQLGSINDNGATFDGGAPRIVFATATGRIGIGTSTPYRTLSVQGSGVFTGGDVLASTLTATSSLSVGVDTDVSAQIGRAHVGYVGSGLEDYAGFSHIDMDAATSYALLQSSAGDTFVNAASGKPISLRTNNTNVAQIYSDGLRLIAGSASAPSLTFISDTNTGIYNSTADQLDFTLGGIREAFLHADGLTIDNSLFVGDATYGPTDAGLIADGTSFRMVANIAVPFELRQVAAQPIQFKTTNLDRVIITASGDVGIGTTTPGGQLASVSSSNIVHLRVVNTQAAATSYNFLIAESGGGADTEFNLRGDGNAFADGTWGGPADFAEWTRVVGDPSSYQPGDIVSFSSENRRAEHTTTATRSKILGAVTLKPGFVGVSYDLGTDVTDAVGDKSPAETEVLFNAKMVALIGYTPIRVTTENGPLVPGDPITISSIEGAGKKAQPGQTIVGYAMEAFDPANGKMGTHNVALPTATEGETFTPLTTLTTTPSGASVWHGWVFAHVKAGIAPIESSLSFDALGRVGIGTSSPAYELQVVGDIGAISFVNTSTRDAKEDISHISESDKEDMLAQLTQLQVATYRYRVEDASDPLRIGLIAEEAAEIAPQLLSPDGKGVDLYKLATFTLAGTQELALRLETVTARVNSLEERMALLESGAVSSGSSSPFVATSSSLASALSGFGVLIENGIAQFNTLVFRQLVASSDEDGTSSAGSVTILAGNTVAQVNNSLVKASTKVFITFNGPVAGSWWVSDKQAGSFRVVLSSAQESDVSFDYFLVQTEGQLSSSTVAPSVSQSSGPDVTAPVITLLGDNPLHIEVGGAFSDPGVQAIDASGSAVTITTFVDGIERVVSADTITTSNPTTYIITYRAMDTAGNSSTALRSVIVGNPDGTVSLPPAPEEEPAGAGGSSDTTAPVVSLVGAAAIELAVGAEFSDPGATATDETDGDLTGSIVVLGAVNTATQGLYTLTYSATDAAGNEGSASRVVTVVALEEPAPEPILEPTTEPPPEPTA